MKCTSLSLSRFPSLSRLSTVVVVVVALYAFSICVGDRVGVGVGVGGCVGVGVAGPDVAWVCCVLVDVAVLLLILLANAIENTQPKTISARTI